MELLLILYKIHPIFLIASEIFMYGYNNLISFRILRFPVALITWVYFLFMVSRWHISLAKWEFPASTQSSIVSRVCIYCAKKEKNQMRKKEEK